GLLAPAPEARLLRPDTTPLDDDRLQQEQNAAAAVIHQKLDTLPKGRTGEARRGNPKSNTHQGDPPGGPGKSKASQRPKSQMRWIMIFSRRDGKDSLAQLRELGAFLAFPDPAKEGRYLFVEDLSKLPASPKAKVLKEINRIYWVDDRPESVSSLARALGI